MSNILDLQKLPYFRNLNFDTVFDKQVSIPEYICHEPKLFAVVVHNLQSTQYNMHGAKERRCD